MYLFDNSFYASFYEFTGAAWWQSTRKVCMPKTFVKGGKCFRDQVAYFQQIHEITQQFNHSGWEKHGHLDTKIQAKPVLKTNWQPEVFAGVLDIGTTFRKTKITIYWKDKSLRHRRVLNAQ